MSFYYSLVTALLTTTLGLGVFLIGQVVLKLVIEPIQEQRKIIGEVSYALLVYEPNVVRSVGEEEARTHLRTLAGKLQSTLRSIPFYSRLEAWGWVTEAESVKDAVTGLARWSNHLKDEEKSRRIVVESQVTIRSKLGITQSIGAIVEVGSDVTDEDPSDSP